MAIYQSITDMIGKTPMLRLKAFEPKPNIEIYAKLEYTNPAGSVKDRIGKHMLDMAESNGWLKPGSTIVEATAGNTGLGIALAAIGRPYKLIFTVPEKFSVEKITLLKALGAEVVLTPKEDGMTGAITRAEQIRSAIPGAISLKQFENPANPAIHFMATGPEIYEDMDGAIDLLVAGAGSGGTISGVSRYLKSRLPQLKTLVADPLGSTMGGGEEGCYAIEGIGNHFIPDTMDMSVIDGFITVTDDEAFEKVKELALKSGIFVGSSSGAALSAAIKATEQMSTGRIVVILPDRGDRYFSKGLYD